MNDLIADIVCELPGWCPLDHVLMVSDLIEKRRLKYVVEIGVFAGRSFLPLAFSVAKNKGQMVGVDPFQPSEQLDHLMKQYPLFDFKRFETNLRNKIIQYGMKKNTKLITKDSAFVSLKLPTDIDLLHLNGNFGSFTAFNDALNYSKKVKKGGFYWFESFKQEEIDSVLRDKKIKCDVVHKFNDSNFIMVRK